MPKLVIDVISLSAVEMVVDRPDAVVEIVDDITFRGSDCMPARTGLNTGLKNPGRSKQVTGSRA